MWNKFHEYFPIVISAPSGSGKTTICNRITRENPGKIVFSKSCTTRKRRPKDSGDSYFFISQEEFEQKIQNNDFIEWAKVHDNYYGTLKEVIDQTMKNGQSVLMDIDVQGAVQIRKNIDLALFIFILPPSLKVLEERLRGRGSDSEDVIQLRLKNAMDEMKYIHYYDYVVVNDLLEEAVSAVNSIIYSFSYRFQLYNKQFLNQFPIGG